MDALFEPVVLELPSGIAPVDAFRRLASLPHCVFFDSAMRHPELGRYSFVSADPFALETATDAANLPLDHLAKVLAAFPARRIDELPPFQGGAAGLLSYDLNRTLEKIPSPRYIDFPMPLVSMGIYDVVLAFDHIVNKGWIISHGFPETGTKRQRRAQQRADEFKQRIQSTEPGKMRQPQTPIQLAGPNHCIDENLFSDFSREEYLAAIERAIEYVYAGDIFQVNLAQRLASQATCDSVKLYLKLRECNPATFAGYFDFGGGQIVSASPERFLKVVDRSVEARPIKGTRQRTSQPEADLFAGSELLASEKDRAENVMIVDLMRNDLSRVCEPESIVVPQLCEIENYGYVQHLVSSVCGKLASGRNGLDLLKASFPGGSITGAPKVRAMEIISEIEQHARGAYCGSLGYIGFDGTMDMSILIRTITASAGWWQFPVGGGIVAQSMPKHEYEETWHKAEGLLQTLRQCQKI